MPKSKVFLRSPYNYDRDAASLETGLQCRDDDLAKQEFKDECDINEIMRRFNVTGQMPVGVRMPSYGDFRQIMDFQSAANAIASAHESFDEMPAEVRKRFDNDPAAFVAFCDDPANLAEARKLGLVPPAEVIPPAAPAPAAPAPAAPAPAAPGGGGGGVGGVT